MAAISLLFCLPASLGCITNNILDIAFVPDYDNAVDTVDIDDAAVGSLEG
jgi:hypothetical protein